MTSPLVDYLRHLADLLENEDMSGFYGAEFTMQTNHDKDFQALRGVLEEPLDLEVQDVGIARQTMQNSLCADVPVWLRVTCMENPRAIDQHRVHQLRRELAEAEATLAKHDGQVQA